jgi:ribosome-binding factor A
MSQRIEQINEILRAELATLISREGVLPNGLITITYVDCSPDLKRADIAISVLPENLSGTALKNLSRSSHTFCGVLRKKLKMRIIPKFNWIIDKEKRRAFEMEKVFDQIKD